MSLTLKFSIFGLMYILDENVFKLWAPWIELHFICNPLEHKSWQNIDYNNTISNFCWSEEK